MAEKEVRLIDANIFIRDLTAMKSMYDAIAIDGMIKALKEAPTIGPENMRAHGRWLIVETDDEQFYICKNCKKKEYWESNYCPNCGAKMDKED